EYLRRQKELEENNKRAMVQDVRNLQEFWERNIRLANVVLPIGWLPLGVMSSAEGRFWLAALGLLGMSAIGATSLRRASLKTVGQFQGQLPTRARRPVPTPRTASAASTPASARKAGTLLLEAQLPGLSEPVSSIALATFRSLLRSPEAKMT